MPYRLFLTTVPFGTIRPYSVLPRLQVRQRLMPMRASPPLVFAAAYRRAQNRAACDASIEMPYFPHVHLAHSSAVILSVLSLSVMFTSEFFRRAI